MNGFITDFFYFCCIFPPSLLHILPIAFQEHQLVSRFCDHLLVLFPPNLSPLNPHTWVFFKALKIITTIIRLWKGTFYFSEQCICILKNFALFSPLHILKKGDLDKYFTTMATIKISIMMGLGTP